MYRCPPCQFSLPSYIVEMSSPRAVLVILTEVEMCWQELPRCGHELLADLNIRLTSTCALLCDPHPFFAFPAKPTEVTCPVSSSSTPALALPAMFS